MRNHLQGACAALILTATSASAANAASYHFVGMGSGPEGAIILLDADSIKADGANRSVWTLTVPYHETRDDKGRSAAYLQTFYTYDCTAMVYKTNVNQIYTLMGEWLYSSQPSEWQPLPPNSPIEQAAHMVCDPSGIKTPAWLGLNANGGRNGFAAFVMVTRQYGIDHGWNQ